VAYWRVDAADYTTGTIEGQDRLTLFCRIWNRDAVAGKDLFLVHGLGEHSGRYVHVGRYFAKAGYRTIAFDLRGHGRSGGKPVFIKRYEELAADVQSVVNHFGGNASFLFGHSMGGQLVLWAARHCRMNLAGVIASAPWLGLAQPPPRWQVVLARVLNMSLPGFRFSTNVDRANLSHDQAHLDSLEDLDLLHGFITVRFYFEAMRAAEQIVHKPVIDVPVLLVQGGDDRVTSRDTVEAFYKKLKAPIKTLKIYPRLFHELHNETERREVMDFFLDWMNSVSRLDPTIQSGSLAQEEGRDRS
jgi:alpha-beta hydrolase superfamily lysophospholipase